MPRTPLWQFALLTLVRCYLSLVLSHVPPLSLSLSLSSGHVNPSQEGCVCVHPDSGFLECVQRDFISSKGMPGNSAVGIQRRHRSFSVIWNPDADSTYLLSVKASG